MREGKIEQTRFLSPLRGSFSEQYEERMSMTAQNLIIIKVIKSEHVCVRAF